MNDNATTEVRQPTSQEIDRGFEVLSDGHRRYVLSYVSDANRPVPREELIDAVTAWKRDAEGDAHEDVDRETVAILLYHTHLPKLEAAGFIDRTDDGIEVATPGNRTLATIRTELERVFQPEASGGAL